MAPMPYELLASGGPLLWIILALGAVAFLVFLERSLHLHRSRIDETDLLSGIITNLRHGNDTEAIRQRNVPRADLVSILHAEGLSEISRMERRLSVLALIAQSTPVLGLLGTVLALLRTVLYAQANAPFIQSADFLRGLVPALTTTAAGLVVAIPAYAAFHVLVVKIDRLVLDMEHAAAEIVQYLDAHRGPGDSRQRTLGL